MVDLKQIDTIIFDFGGVILDIEPERTIDAFTSLVGKDALDKVIESGLLQKIETGRIQPGPFIIELKKMVGKEFSDTEFFNAWNAILLNYHPKRIEVIKKLAKSHQLFLLSNTNQIHFNHFSQKLYNEYHLTFNDLFKKAYVSHEMGKIKPDQAIYNQVIEEQALIPERTLFIEDTPENALAAEELGIKTLVIPRNGMFYEYFNDF